MNLYELTVDEEKYVRLSKTLSNILNDPDVEGVYESKVPLLFRALVQVGCVCKINASKIDDKVKLN